MHLVMLLGRYSLPLYEPALRIVLKGRHKQESPHKQEPSICLSAVDSIHRAAKSPLTRLRLVSKRRGAPVQGVLGYDRRTPEVPVESGTQGELVNSLSGWEQVAVMSSENMVVVQGQGLDIDELGIALHQETQSGGAEHVFYPCSRVFSVAALPAQHES
jgi:hypothetical protein